MADDDFSVRVDKYIKGLENVIQLASKYGTKDLHTPSIYTNLAKDICELEVAHQKVEKALDASKNEENLRSFEQKYERELVDSKAPRNKKSKRFLAFEKYTKEQFKTNVASTSTIQSGSGVIQVGDVIFDDFVSDIDPITKKPMIHPMKNKKCGHYYEKETILEMISTNRHLRCPVVGCSNKNPIIPSNLVEDHDFVKVLEKRRQQQEEDSD